MSQNTREDAPAGRKTLELDGLTPEALYREGSQYFKARDYDSARDCFEQYALLRPDDAAAQHFLARVYYHQNRDLDRAEDCIKRAIELDPASETRYLETLGTIYIHLGDYARAEEVFAYALSADRKDNPKHTYSLEFYLNLVRKKHKKAKLQHKPETPVFIKTGVDRWHERNRQPLFIIPSIVVHILVFFLVWFVYSHDLTIKEAKEDFTYVDVEKPAEPEPRERAAPGEQQESSPPASEPSPEAHAEQVAPAPAVPRKDVQAADVSKETGKAVSSAAAAKVQGESGLKQTVGQKSMAGVKAGGQAGSAAVKGISSEKSVDLKSRAITAYQPDVEFAKKGMGEASQLKGRAGAKEASVGHMEERQAATPAGGGEGIFLGDRGHPKDSKWSKEKAAGALKTGTPDAGAPGPAFKSAEKSLAVGRAGKRLMASQEEPGSFKPMPLGIEGQGRKSEARSGGSGAVTSIEKGASSAPVRGGQGLNAGQDRTDGVSPSGKVKGILGVPVAPQQNADLGAPGGDRKPDFGSRAGTRKFASAEPLPGKKALNWAGQPAQGGAQGRQGAEHEGAPAGVERGQTAAPQGMTVIRNAKPGSSGGGPGAVGGKAAAVRAIGSGGQDTGGEGFFESTANKMSAVLGLGGKGTKPGGGLSEADLRKPKSLSAIGGAAQGSGPGTGGARTGKGQGIKIGGGEKAGSGTAPPSVAGGAGQPGAGPSVSGSKKMTEGALGVPGGSGQDRYASAGRGEARPGGTEKQSGVSRAGRSVARNTVGPVVSITSPKPGRTNRLSQVITGTVSDARARKATIIVNNESKVISVERGSFEAVVALSKGRNTVTVMAFDMEGNVGKDSITLDYSEPSEGPPITIISPRDGQVVDVSERSVVSVKGTVADQDIKKAKLIFNGNPMDITVNRGFFDQKVALVQEQNTVLVEAASAGGGVSRSKLITIGTVNVKPKDIMIILTWDKPHADLDLHVYGPQGGHTSYKTPNIYESKEAIAGAQLEQDAKGNYGPEVFTQDKAEKGVYTVKSNYFYSGGDGNAYATVTVILYGDNPSRRQVRVFGPHLQVDTKSGEDVWNVTKFKMPDEFFLED